MSSYPIQNQHLNVQTNSPILELKTKIEIDKSMKLIDINGKKINFQSDCFIKPNNPNDTFYVTIVNQTDLDEGNIKFDIFDQVKEGNMYKRRITYESDNGEHLNHYIALKKLPKNVTDNTIQAEVVIRLTELEQKQPQQPLYSPLDIQNDNDHDQNQYQEQDQYQEQPQLIDSTNEPETVEELKEQLYKLSQSSDYINNKNNINFYKKIGMACLFVIVLYIIFRKK